MCVPFAILELEESGKDGSHPQNVEVENGLILGKVPVTRNSRLCCPNNNHHHEQQYREEEGNIRGKTTAEFCC